MPSPADRRAGRTAEWDPKYPDVAMAPQQGVYEEALHGGVEYTRAPASSHVYGWRVKAGGLLKFLGPQIGAPADTRALLEVAFKPPIPKGQTLHPDRIASEYAYAFPSVDAANGVAAALMGAADPGEVVHQMLIEPRVWYKRITKVKSG